VQLDNASRTGVATKMFGCLKKLDEGSEQLPGKMCSLSVPLLVIGISIIALSAAAPNLANADDVASCMKAQPYVEETCQASSFPGWPYDAKDCSYSTPIGTLYVTVADAPAERVAAWVLNATLTVPWTADLQSDHPGAFLQVQKILAVDVMFQRYVPSLQFEL